MTFKEKILMLNEKVDNKEKIKILFLNTSMENNIRGSNVKNKSRVFYDYLMKKNDERFDVINVTTFDEYKETYKDCDLIIPPMQYEFFFGDKDKEILADIYENKKLVNIRYSLAWHKIIQDKIYSNAFLNCIDDPSIGRDIQDVYTGHPWSECLKLPKEEFKDPWKTTNKKRILVCPHHSIDEKNNMYGNQGDLLEWGEEFLELVNKYRNEVEFVMRPHPNLYCIIENNFNYKKMDHNRFKKILDILFKCKDMVTFNCDEDYISWFKYSDALVHDGGSFRCEYLYMNKPVCYMANETNMENSKFSQMGLEAMNCHEICYKSRGDKLESFILNVINEIDEKAELRNKYYEKYCEYYPNGKTPCENIVNAILGQQEYSYLRMY